MLRTHFASRLQQKQLGTPAARTLRSALYAGRPICVGSRFLQKEHAQSEGTQRPTQSISAPTKPNKCSNCGCWFGGLTSRGLHQTHDSLQPVAMLIQISGLSDASFGPESRDEACQNQDINPVSTLWKPLKIAHITLSPNIEPHRKPCLATNKRPTQDLKQTFRKPYTLFMELSQPCQDVHKAASSASLPACIDPNVALSVKSLFLLRLL